MFTWIHYADDNFILSWFLYSESHQRFIYSELFGRCYLSHSINKKLEKAQSTKDIGITFTDNLKWGQHILEISSKVTKTMGFFGAVLDWYLVTLKKLHTKHCFAFSSSMQQLFGIPITKLRFNRRRRCRGQLPG